MTGNIMRREKQHSGETIDSIDKVIATTYYVLLLCLKKPPRGLLQKWRTTVIMNREENLVGRSWENRCNWDRIIFLKCIVLFFHSSLLQMAHSDSSKSRERKTRHHCLTSIVLTTICLLCTKQILPFLT